MAFLQTFGYTSASAKHSPHGELAEWSNAAVLKTVDGLNRPGVRIPHSPPIILCVSIAYCDNWAISTSIAVF